MRNAFWEERIRFVIINRWHPTIAMQYHAMKLCVNILCKHPRIFYVGKKVVEFSKLINFFLIYEIRRRITKHCTIHIMHESLISISRIDTRVNREILFSLEYKASFILTVFSFQILRVNRDFIFALFYDARHGRFIPSSLESHSTLKSHSHMINKIKS